MNEGLAEQIEGIDPRSKAYNDAALLKPRCPMDIINEENYVEEKRRMLLALSSELAKNFQVFLRNLTPPVDPITGRKEFVDFVIDAIHPFIVSMGLGRLSDQVWLSKFGLESGYEIVKSFARDVVSGVSIFSFFAEIIPYVYRDQFDRKMELEEYISIVRSRSFQKIFPTLAKLGAPAELAILRALGHGDYYKVPVLASASFGFKEMENEALILVMREDVRKKAIEYYDPNQEEEKRSCPALYVKGENGEGGFFDEFLQWMTDFFVEHYLPQQDTLQCTLPCDRVGLWIIWKISRRR